MGGIRDVSDQSSGIYPLLNIPEDAASSEEKDAISGLKVLVVHD